MSWAAAQATAGERVKFLLAKFNPPAGARIRLALFEDAATYIFLKGADEWPFEFHRMVIRAMARDLKKRGYKIELPILELAKYYDWLDQQKIKDSPAARAQFISQ